jgi:hypothetical protein
MMYTRILTEKERARIHAYMRANGEKTSAIRQLVTRVKQHQPEIERDLALMKELITLYEKQKTR